MKKTCKVLCSIDTDGYFIALGDSDITEQRLLDDMSTMVECGARLYWLEVDLEVPEIPVVETIRIDGVIQGVQHV